eukprot:GEMP01066590.1.p1 GENE.GEMP01066590.1~~GEMP01066590.1.p1  ORF type:complete len:314 (+),score=77.27 GEMP01066590.1:181-1122(+)
MSDEVAEPASPGRPFLSSFKSSDKVEQPYARRQKLVLETIPGAGPRITELHEELKKLAENMDKKVHNMLREHEQDFFFAYKAHMYVLQKEFKALKAKADEEDTKTRRDSKIQSLERELDWFMAEALRLDELCKGYKKEVDKWKAKSEAIEEDRRYLEDQIKGSKRQNKVLRAAVERAQYAASVAAQPQKPPSPKQGVEPFVLPQIRPSSADEYQQQGRLEDGRLSAPPGIHVATASNKTLQQKQKAISADEQKYLETVRGLKSEVLQEQNSMRAIRAEMTDAYSLKSMLEEFFLECIDESRKDLSRRKRPVSV